MGSLWKEFGVAETKEQRDPEAWKSDQLIKEQLDFERLLANIAARFVALACDSLDGEIETAQQQICECLGIEVCSLWQLSPDSKSLLLTHIYKPLDFKPISYGMDAYESFPWCLQKLLRKEAVILDQIADAPPTAKRDQESWMHYDVKSVLTLPLSAGGGAVFGALSFCVLGKGKKWGGDLVNRLQLVAQIFASALARKIAEIALRESEARFQLAADSANAGLWSWDYKTGKIWVTEKTRSLYGFFPDEEITGDRFLTTLHPDDLERVRFLVERTFRVGTVIQIEYRILLPDRSIRWIAARGQAYLNPSGEPDRMMGVSLDISENKQNEIERLRLRLELSHIARVMTMNELSTSLAHEINQPLGAILNNASAAHLLISRIKDKPGDVAEILVDIIKDSKRAGDVVRKIRGIVKKEEAQFDPLDMNLLIEDVVALFQNVISMNRVTLLLNLEPSLPKIRGDRVRLQQVLMNLITNALEAMAGHSLKTLMIRSTQQTSDGMVAVSVSDSGTGIKDADIDKVFDSFFTTKKDGLGMGLRICRSIIEEHEGRIGTENNPTGGAVFSFSLKPWNGKAS
jgi:PAS domain S-box-containing protein